MKEDIFYINPKSVKSIRFCKDEYFEYAHKNFDCIKINYIDGSSDWFKCSKQRAEQIINRFLGIENDGIKIPSRDTSVKTHGYWKH